MPSATLKRMFDPELILDRLGGLARGSRLQAFGIDRSALSKAAKAGRIDRIRPGLYASLHLTETVRHAASHGGALTCSAALRVHGIWVLADEGRAHVWVGRRGRAHEHDGCRCHSHYFRGAVPLGCVSVETALIHLFHCEGDESFFASLESALRLGRLTGPALHRIRAALPAYARWLIDFADPASESGLESLLRLRLHLLGILLATQVMIPEVGRADFVVGGRLIIEVDGRQNHDGPVTRHKDLVRDAAASALGYETLRFDYAQVVHDWPAVQAAVLAALSRTAELA